MSKVTKKQAEAVLNAVAVWLGARGLGEARCPRGRELNDLVQHTDDGSDCLFAVAGPAPTGHDAAYRGLGPELVMEWNDAPTILLEGGPYDWAVDCSFAIQSEMKKQGVNVYVEPYAGYALSIYPG